MQKREDKIGKKPYKPPQLMFTPLKVKENIQASPPPPGPRPELICSPPRGWC